MIHSLLSWLKLPVGEGAFYAGFGFLFVLSGIALLVGIFTLFGIAMKRINARPKKKRVIDEVQTEERAEEGISPELIAVITAAVAAAMQSEEKKCDFVVKRVRRVK